MSQIHSIMLPFVRNSIRQTQTSAKRFMTGKAGPVSTVTSTPDVSKVQGLSRNVVDVPNTPVGPGAAKDKPYKNPEYFCYNTTSYFEAEVEMAKFRLPQPSNKIPLK